MGLCCMNLYHFTASLLLTLRLIWLQSDSLPEACDTSYISEGALVDKSAPCNKK